MHKVAGVQLLQDPDAKKLRMEARRAAKEARLARKQDSLKGGKKKRKSEVQSH
jgi:hypothetical protein